jgi:hypothetical protein
MRNLALFFVVGLVAAAVALSAAAASPAAPIVVTGSASALTTNSASLAGSVTPNGARTSYWFEYGTSTSYGSQTGTRHAGTGIVSLNLSANVRGLTAMTTYHFRLVAANSAGTTDGADATFTTAAAPVPTAVTGAATGITTKDARLTGTVTPNGSPTTYSFQYGTSATYGLQTGTRYAGSGSRSQNVSAGIGGLAAGTAYHYRLVATNAAGTTDGADETFTTTSAPAPVVVTGAAGNVTTNSAALAGSVTPNGSPTTYWFEYGTSTSYGSQTGSRHAGSGAGSQNVSARLRGLMAGTTYHFRLVASNAAGTTDGADATFVTATAALPSVVTGAANRVTARNARLAGTIDPNGAQTTYSFQYGTSTGYGSQTATRNAGHGTSNRNAIANVFGLTPGTLYHYRLVASNSAGTTDGADQTFTTATVAPLPHKHWFAGTVTAVESNMLTVGVLWTGPHDGSLNGQTVTVSVPTSTRINEGPHHKAIAIAQIQPGDLVALLATGDTAATLTATRIHVYCNCHWIGGTISAIASSGTSFSVQVRRTGPYDGVLKGQNVTLQVNAATVYLHGPHHNRIGFSDLKVGQGVGIVFAASGFFKAPGFDPTTATFTAKRVHVWGHGQVPPASSDSGDAAQTAVSN